MEKNSFWKRLSTNKVYSVLFIGAVCLVIIVIAVMAVNAILSPAKPDGSVPASESTSAAVTAAAVSSAAEETTSASESEKPEEKTAHTEDLNTKTQPNIMPLSGEVICAFSNGELVKSETLGVWKTHDGIDIKAELGAPVKAMNKGKVIKVWSDSLWGNCIKIDHGNGVTGHYYGLTAAAAVSEGDMVNSGDVIGAVGDTAQIEVAQATHLHFALDRNGTWIDPVEYISPSAK